MFKENKKNNNVFLNNLFKIPKILIVPIILGSLAANPIKSNNEIIVDNVSTSILEMKEVDVKNVFTNFPDKFTSMDIAENTITVEMLDDIIKYNELFDKQDFESHKELKTYLFWEIQSNELSNDLLKIEDKLKILNTMVMMDTYEMDGNVSIKDEYLKIKDVNLLTQDYDNVTENFILDYEYLTFLPINIEDAENNLEKEKILKLNILEKILNHDNAKVFLSKEDFLLVAFEYEKENEYFLDKLKNTLVEVDR